MRRVRRLLPAITVALLALPAAAPAKRKPSRCGLSKHQHVVLRAAHAQAHRLNAPYAAQLALIEAGWVESRLRDLSWGDADSEGWLQLRVGIHGRALARSVRRSTRAFLERGFTGRGGAIRLARRTSWTAGRIAQAVQGSAHPHRYHAARLRARRLHRCISH